MSRACWVLALVAAACAPAPAGQTPPARAASAELRDRLGQLAGRVDLLGRGADSTVVSVRMDAMRMAASEPRGVHLHQVGRCDVPDFASAGGHLNPYARQHGRHNPRGAHAGDLPNVPTGGVLEYTLAVPFDSIMDADGAAVIVHGGTDA